MGVEPLTAVDAQDAALQYERIAVEHGVGRDRGEAAAFEAAAARARRSRRHARAGSSIVAALPVARMSSAAPLDAQGRLAGCGQHDVQRQPLTNLVVQSQPVEPGLGQHDGGVLSFLEFADARVDVAAEVGHRQVGPHVQQLPARRRRLPVPTIAPGGSAVERREVDGKRRTPGGARAGTAASISPGTGSVGRSLRLCTVRSTSPRSSAS